jgi:hypothetical protein
MAYMLDFMAENPLPAVPAVIGPHDLAAVDALRMPRSRA